jgi:hypothetical protein
MLKVGSRVRPKKDVNPKSAFFKLAGFQPIFKNQFYKVREIYEDPEIGTIIYLEGVVNPRLVEKDREFGYSADLFEDLGEDDLFLKLDQYYFSLN